jgi:hypothetical protein
MINAYYETQLSETGGRRAERIVEMARNRRQGRIFIRTLFGGREFYGEYRSESRITF